MSVGCFPESQLKLFFSIKREHLDIASNEKKPVSILPMFGRQAGFNGLLFRLDLYRSPNDTCDVHLRLEGNSQRYRDIIVHARLNIHKKWSESHTDKSSVYFFRGMIHFSGDSNEHYVLSYRNVRCSFPHWIFFRYPDVHSLVAICRIDLEGFFDLVCLFLFNLVLFCTFNKEQHVVKH